ncbi:unnamed protein product [Anisakis simplex]|uniref:C2H2-type domain-containing protein n=1 Tax=Anisakis simplex TaxID=6269 RepID=A0A0M3JIL9_ANISI|nr:unnamed protein product [Anisakis simplex]
MSEKRYPSVNIECSLCSLNNLNTPENLCAHMKQRHGMHSATVQYIRFNDPLSFQFAPIPRIIFVRVT